jgi:transcriptional regulator of arginine metabolism
MVPRMANDRLQRQREIVYLLSQSAPRSAEDVAKLLSDEGHEVTQAMVARDLEQIGAVKMKSRGKVGYVLPENIGQRDKAKERLQRIFAEWAQSVETSGNLIVIRTPPGSAHLVALAIDQAKFPEVAGTIAGDDALLVAIRDGHTPEPLALRLSDLLGEI